MARQVGLERGRHLWMGTCHSICLRILHAEADQMRSLSGFTINDTANSNSLLVALYIHEMGLDERVYKPGNCAGPLFQPPRITFCLHAGYSSPF
jgi:Superfamily I DNA and RNA helicases